MYIRTQHPQDSNYPGDIHHEHVSPTPVKFKSSLLYHMCPPNIIKTASGVKHVRPWDLMDQPKTLPKAQGLEPFGGINYLLQRCLVVIFHGFSKVGKMCGRHVFVFVKTPCLKTEVQFLRIFLQPFYGYPLKFRMRGRELNRERWQRMTKESKGGNMNG